MSRNRTDFKDVGIHVDELEIGMHVVKLDRPWESTTFLMQSFIIQTKQEIQELQEQCETVFVQVQVERVQQFVDKHKALQAGSRKKKIKTTKPATKQGPQSVTRVNYINQVNFDQAVKESKMTFDSARSLSRSVLDSVRVGRALDLNECKKEVENIVDSVISNKDALRFLSMIKSKDEYTAQHSMNVCVLSATFGRHLGLHHFEIKLLALCGLLHDVGKARVPSEILNKREPFTKEEAHIMAEHTTYGRNILMSADEHQRHVVDVAHSHHERVDGKGYPRSLSASQIPYYAKAICVVDAYDAMTSERCYGNPKTSEHALRLISISAGKQFDAELAHEFVRCIGFYPIGSLVELENEQLAIIFRPNDEHVDRPLLLVVTDAKHKKLLSPSLLDLSKIENKNRAIIRQVVDKTAGIETSRYIKRFINPQ